MPSFISSDSCGAKFKGAFAAPFSNVLTVNVFHSGGIEPVSFNDTLYGQQEVSKIDSSKKAKIGFILRYRIL
jgi:hypothetical protein